MSEKHLARSLHLLENVAHGGRSTPLITSSNLAAVLPILEGVNDGIHVFAPHGELVYANASAADFSGCESPEAYLAMHQEGCWGLTMMSLQDVSGNVLEKENLPCSQSLDGRIFTEQVVNYVDYRQRDRQAAIKAFPIKNDLGEVMYGIVICRDLTQQYRASEAVKQRTKQLYQIADIVSNPVAYLDSQQRHYYANKAYLRIFNVTSLQSVMGKGLQTILDTVLYHQLQSGIEQALQGESVDLCVSTAPIASPKSYAHVSIIPQWENKRVAGICLVFDEVEAYKQTTKLLQSEADFFRHALESAAVGIWDWNLRQNEMIWSRPQEKLFGLMPNGFDGHLETFLNLVDVRDRDRLRAAIDDTLHGKSNLSVEFRVNSLHALRWLSCRGQVRCNTAGEITHIAGITFDITARKRAERKLFDQVKRDHLIAKISQEISHCNNLRKVLPQFLNAVRVYLEAERLVLIDLRKHPVGKVTFEDHSPDMQSMLSWNMRHPWSVKEKFLTKYRQGYAIAVPDIEQQSLDDADLGFFRFFQITADLTVPLRENGNLWGILSAQYATSREWQPADCRLLETFGTLVSTAAQREQLHHNLTKANKELKRFAYLDSLTQIGNRRRFEQFLGNEWRRLMRDNLHIALIMADIDHFKAYNDVYGHQSGDECLRRVAGILTKGVKRPADMVARYGGEEFVIVLSNTDLKGANAVAEKLRDMVKAQNIQHLGSATSNIVTLSWGVTAMIPHPLKSADDLIHTADEALYQAKASGRDRIVCSRPDGLLNPETMGIPAQDRSTPIVGSEIASSLQSE